MIDRLINTSDSRLKFTPLYPEVKIDINLVRKKHHPHSKALEKFLNEIENAK